MIGSPKVSVCVPVYGTEQYLRKCLESVVHQTLTDIEIIVVNDASLDNSESIIKEYLASDVRIKYLKHETNRGLSKARETAIRQASGKYVGFVDSDDWIALRMMEKLYDKAEQTRSDIVVCDFSDVGGSSAEIKKALKTKAAYFSKESPSFNIYPHGVNPGYWNKLFKRELFFREDIYFLSSLYMAEDMLVTSKLFFFANRITFLDEALYYYYTAGEKEDTEEKLMANLRDEIKVHEALYAFFVPRNKEAALKKHLYVKHSNLHQYAKRAILLQSVPAENLLRTLIDRYYGEGSLKAVDLDKVMRRVKLALFAKTYLPTAVFRIILSCYWKYVYPFWKIIRRANKGAA